MTRVLLAVMSLLAPIAVVAADDLKISQLEQDVRDLQRLVRAQSQQINDLRMRLGQPSVQPRTSLPSVETSSANSVGVWVDASKWQKLKAGMTELEVISLLGPPTSMRAGDSERVLLYATEIASSGFLSGSVTLRDRIVIEVQSPVLR